MAPIWQSQNIVLSWKKYCPMYWNIDFGSIQMLKQGGGVLSAFNYYCKTLCTESWKVLEWLQSLFSSLQYINLYFTGAIYLLNASDANSSLR